MEKLHIPVLLSQVLATMDPHPGERYLDLTAGYGGHAREILDVTQQYKGSTLVDRDEFAVKYLNQEFPQETGIEIINKSFYSAVLQLLSCGATYDIILADFGVSSPQLDMEERGFSFRFDAPLDMRMDRRQELTAADIINKYSERDLANIFVKYGEESPGRAAMFARVIVHHRPIKSTKELADLIRVRIHGYSRLHPATKIFQAVRIVVNDELKQIEDTLPLLPKLLNRNGRLGFITFHSLEDRLVKNFLKEESSLGEESPLEIITKKPIIAENEELVINPRARSAKLRVAKKRN
ncbi:16S rRNA (cytosine(1402)-N(4))-methyltransferase RsmH [Candidatus Saccharibacteria bacterium]|nr:16S rRNA (cytosine(1402)-N(4))-methyltransferase RsmH [Candidatus Saccharibacteria bacterium]